MAGGLQLGDAHGRFAAVGFNDGVRVPEGAAGRHDNLDAGFLGGFQDDMVAVASVGVGILFEDEVGDIPGFEELWEEGLGCLTQDEEFGSLVEFGDGGGEIVLTVEAVEGGGGREDVSPKLIQRYYVGRKDLQELPSIGSSLCSIDIVRIPCEDWPETFRVQV